MPTDNIPKMLLIIEAALLKFTVGFVHAIVAGPTVWLELLAVDPRYITTTSFMGTIVKSVYS